MESSLASHACLLDTDGAALEVADTDTLDNDIVYALSSCNVPLPLETDVRRIDEEWHAKSGGRVADTGIFETPGAESVHAADKPLAQALRKFFMGRRRKAQRGYSVIDLGCGDGDKTNPNTLQLSI